MPLLFAPGRWFLPSPANLGLLVSVLILAGCEARPQISSYTVPKESIVDQAGKQASSTPQGEEPRQILGAIFVQGDTGWFFKATDEPARLGPITADVRKFVESVRFPAEGSGEPTWTLPEGWSREPGNQFRFATIRAGEGANAPEISVSQLPGPEEGGQDEFVLVNVNRWRGQVGLEPLKQDALKNDSESIKAGDVSGVWVDLKGKAPAGGGNMMAPFAGGGAGARPPLGPAAGSVNSPAPGTGLKYTTPEGWEEEGAGGFRKASFKVADGDKLLDISVSDLSAEAGDLLPNINRWRQQVKLPEITQEELDKQLKPIKFGEVDGHFIEIVGEAQDGSGKETILGAIAIHGDKAWFVKARGAAALAEREKQRFEQFVRSIQFE